MVHKEHFKMLTNEVFVSISIIPSTKDWYLEETKKSLMLKRSKKCIDIFSFNYNKQRTWCQNPDVNYLKNDVNKKLMIDEVNSCFCFT